MISDVSPTSCLHNFHSQFCVTDIHSSLMTLEEEDATALTPLLDKTVTKIFSTLYNKVMMCLNF